MTRVLSGKAGFTLTGQGLILVITRASMLAVASLVMGLTGHVRFYAALLCKLERKEVR